jgi:hypothetical protein
MASESGMAKATNKKPGKYKIQAMTVHSDFNTAENPAVDGTRSH